MSNLPDFSACGYQATRQLGFNAAGGRVVYLAADRNTQKQVVIKQFQFAKGSEWSEFKAVEREIQGLQGLNHKGIPHYIGSFETEDGYCIVLEYKNAQTLSAQHSYTPQQIKQITVSVLEILIYLQNRIPPIIHRDIKPENILVDEQINVYLIDFGFARLGGGAAAMSSVAAGTFGFMAPEQIYNKDLTTATDLYGLGATLIALLTATKSTEMGTLIDEDNRIAFQSLVPKLSFRFIHWLEKMVAPKLKDRYPDAAAALEELRSLDIIRFPSVEFKRTIKYGATIPSKKLYIPSYSSIDTLSLEFTSILPGKKLTQTIIIINPTPETILEGTWSVAPHPNDPPHSPDSHAWISFSPREFKGNEVKCQITVDTSKLIAQASGKRSLILHANTDPGTHALKLHVNTAPFPVAKKLPYLMTASLLILAGFLGVLFGVVSGSDTNEVSKLNVIMIWTFLGTVLARVLCDVLNAVFPDMKFQFRIFVWIGAILGTFLGGGAVFGLPSGEFLAFLSLFFGFSFLYFNSLDRQTFVFVSLLIIFLAIPFTVIGFSVLFKTISDFGIFSVAIAIAILVAFAVITLEESTRKYLELDEFRRCKFRFLILLMLGTEVFGICLGIGLKIGFLNNFYLFFATLATGVLSTFLFFFAPLQRYRLLATYRQREPYLIRP